LDDLRFNAIKRTPTSSPTKIDSTGNPGIATTKTVPLPPVITSRSILTAARIRVITAITAHIEGPLTVVIQTTFYLVKWSVTSFSTDSSSV
jgi:hypothetical protein